MKIILFPEYKFPIRYDTNTKEVCCNGDCKKCPLYCHKIEDTDSGNCLEYIEQMIIMNDYEIEKR